MPFLTSLVRGLSSALGPVRRDSQINDEVAFHLASRTDDLIARGLPREEATRRARLEFGAADKYKEQMREARGFPLLSDLARDCRLTVRSLSRSPGLVLVSVLSLGLGIGANTTLFSAIAAIFLSQPTAAHPEELVWVDPGNSNQFSYLNYRDLREVQTFAAVAGYRTARLNLRANGQVESVAGIAVTPNFFQMLGVGAAIGRTFSEEEIGSDPSPRLAVLSYRFWVRQFNGYPTRAGQTLTLNGQPYAIVGVLPADYQSVLLAQDPDVYVPVSGIVLPNLQDRTNSNALNVLARLRPGVTREQGRDAVTAFGQAQERAFPEENRNMGRPARVELLGAMAVSGAPLAAVIFPTILGSLCALVLLIGCANVAGLLLARAAGRQREFALRAALGATRGRLIRALLAESLVLSGFGAAAGLLLTFWLMPVLRDITLPVVGNVHLRMFADAKLYAYTSALAVVTALLCGLIPAGKATRLDLVRQLQQGGGHGATSRQRVRHALVVAEVAAAVVMLVVSLLFMRTLVRVAQYDTGADLDHGLVATIEFAPSAFTRESLVEASRRVVDRLQSIPGVRSASVADIVPLGMDLSSMPFTIEGRSAPRTFINSVGPRYFETMGLNVLRGREFVWNDRPGSPAVVVVSQAFVNANFPGEAPIGKLVQSRDGTVGSIVGIVSDTSYETVAEHPKPVVYFSFSQRPVSTQYRPLHLHVRTAVPPASLLHAVQDIVADVDRSATVRVVTLRQATGFELGLRRAGSTLLLGLGLLGVFLAMIGLYGIVTYIVASRTPEIGVRMALGASQRKVMRDVLAHGLFLTASGIVLGTVLAIAAGRVLVALLAGLSPADPVAFAGSTLALALMGLLASYLPARRATRVDPIIALRHD